MGTGYDHSEMVLTCALNIDPQLVPHSFYIHILLSALTRLAFPRKIQSGAEIDLLKLGDDSWFCLTFCFIGVPEYDVIFLQN